MNWGIIGYGEITPPFIEGLLPTNNGKLVGIASISSFKYLKKTNFYKSVQIFETYKELVNAPEINIVNVSTTNNLHVDNSELVIRSNKHLLYEKPLTATFDKQKN